MIFCKVPALGHLGHLEEEDMHGVSVNISGDGKIDFIAKTHALLYIDISYIYIYMIYIYICITSIYICLLKKLQVDSTHQLR